MSIKYKVLIIICSVAVALSACIYILSSIFLAKNSANIERKEIAEKVDSFLDLIDHDISSLNSTCGDWSDWDESYNFIKNKNSEFIQTNLNNITFLDLKINFMVFVDSSGNIVLEKAFDLNGNKTIELPKVLRKSIYKDSPLLGKSDRTSSIISGIMMADKTPMMVSSRPVKNMQGYSDGTLIIGRFLTDEYIKWANQVIDANVKIDSLDLNKNLKDSQYVQLFIINKNNISSNITSSNSVDGYVVLKDVYGQDGLKIDLNSPRTVNDETYQSFKIFMLLFILSIVAIIIIMMVVFEEVFLIRIGKLNNFINNIRMSKDISTRLYLEGNDEISNLSNATNMMLEEIDSYNKKLIDSESRLRLVMEGANDGFWDIDINSNKMYISSKAMLILEKAEVEVNVSLDELDDIISPLDFTALREVYNKSLQSNADDTFWKDYKVFFPDGKEKWVLIRGRVVMRDKDGKPVRMAGIVADITENKRDEEAIKYLSYHDYLTGIYNRTYFEKELEQLDVERNLPLSIMICDVNSLKLTNDAFGHKEGDRLLITVAEILKQNSRSMDVVSRIGGDEFVVILPNTDEKQAASVLDSIKASCEEAEARPIKPSISIGIVTKNNINEDIQKLLDIAEDRMYKNKLLETRSSKHSILASLEASLLETDYETREHAKRINDVALKIGKKLNLPKNQLDELSLLSTLHDIGKIAIPIDILNKPGKLTKDEWKTVKKHCEIGYRIAITSHELAFIADSILSHHEKWDGSGYPRGLKRENIPLLARIVAIADAYDVITNSRSYKEASTHEEAMEEIIRCSGSHFDPRLVEIFKDIFESDVSAGVLKPTYTVI